MGVIDFHSHILPEMDDGSRNVETSYKMLELCREQQIDTMVATPHFYADSDRIENFLERRKKSFEKLMSGKSFDRPHILLGAEVAFFKGIGKAEKVALLTVEGTDILLLEMPFETWDVSVLEEVRYLLEKRNLKIMIAHPERFLKLPGNASFMKKLLEMPVLLQVNSGSLLDVRQRRVLLKMFKKGQAHVLGSDCHGMQRRPPNLGEGRSVLESRLGKEYLQRMDCLAEELLGRHKKMAERHGD